MDANRAPHSSTRWIQVKSNHRPRSATAHPRNHVEDPRGMHQHGHVAHIARDHQSNRPTRSARIDRPNPLRDPTDNSGPKRSSSRWASGAIGTARRDYAALGLGRTRVGAPVRVA